MTMLVGEQIEQARLLVIRSRLRMELAIPEFAKGSTGAHTLRGCRNLGFNGRTRKQALDWINGLIE